HDAGDERRIGDQRIVGAEGGLARLERALGERQAALVLADRERALGHRLLAVTRASVGGRPPDAHRPPADPRGRAHYSRTHSIIFCPPCPAGAIEFTMSITPWIAPPGSSGLSLIACAIWSWRRNFIEPITWTSTVSPPVQRTLPIRTVWSPLWPIS